MDISELCIVVIGPKHTGKTVYLSALANLRIFLTNPIKDPETTAFIKKNWQRLQEGEVPEATEATLRDLSFVCQSSINGTDCNLDLSIADYDGHFMETLSEYDAERKTLCERIKNAIGFIVLLPADDGDMATMELIRQEIDTFITTVREVFEKDNMIGATLVLAVNKWDKNEGFQTADEDAAAARYVESVELYKNMRDKLENFFSRIAIIPVSAYGHKTEDDMPVRGKLAPYRIEEPVLRIIGDYMKDFICDVERCKQSESPKEFCDYLLDSFALWSRSSLDYEQLLKTKLEEMLSEWEKAGDYAKICEYLLSRRDRLEKAINKDVKAELDSAAEALCAPMYEKLSACEDLKAFEATLNSIPGSDLLDRIESPSKNRILQKKERLLGRQRKKRFMAVAAVFVLCGLGLWSYGAYQYSVLKEEMAEHTGRIESDSASVAAIKDPCERKIAISDILNKASSQSVEPATMEKLRNLLQINDNLCQARGILARPVISREEFENATALLQGTPQADAAPLQQLLATHEQSLKQKEEDARQQEKQRAEEERVAEVIRDIDEILNDRSAPYEDAFQKWRRYQSEQDARIVGKLHELQRSFPSRMCAELETQISEMASLTGDENAFADAFQKIRRYIRDNDSLNLLGLEDLRGITRRLQGMIEEMEGKAVTNIRSSFSSRLEVQITQNEIKKLDDSAKRWVLDGGIFMYERTGNLKEEIKSRARYLEQAQQYLDSGYRTRATLYADEKNAIGMDCGMINPHNDVELNLPGGTLSTVGQKDKFCRKVPGGKGYALDMGVYFVRPTEYVSFSAYEKARGMFGGPGGAYEIEGICNGAVSITESEFFQLINQRKPISLHLCTGLTLMLER